MEGTGDHCGGKINQAQKGNTTLSHQHVKSETVDLIEEREERSLAEAGGVTG
jgi:hypothetical protein